MANKYYIISYTGILRLHNVLDWLGIRWQTIKITIMETLTEAFSAKYPKYSNRVLSLYKKTNGVIPGWNNLTGANLSRFAEFVKKEVALSSARTYCAMFKSVLNLYADQINLPNRYEDILSLKKDVSQNTWLTEGEINKLISYIPDNDTEMIIRDQFVIGALTGARHSDYIGFTEKNIRDGYIRYVSKKTKHDTSVPLSPVVDRLIRGGLSEKNKEFSTTHFNDILQDMCRKIGITEKLKLYRAGKYEEAEKWRFVGSHSARRSFATNLYLRGTDIYLISKLMGHTSVTQTEGYIVCPIRNLPDSVMNYFSSFK